MRYLCVILLSFCIAGCLENKKTVGEFVKWIENPENGLRRSKESEGFEVIAQYRPVAYIICSESKNKTLTPEQYEKRKLQLDGMEYYQVRLRSTLGDPLMFGSSDQNVYHMRNNYLMFGQKEDISLLRNNDTIPCSLYHFVNYQGLAPYADILLGFTADTTFNGEHELIYNDRVFGFGPLHFTFTEDEIKSVPELILN